jgi:cell division topological specificity factor MinE
LKNWLHQLLGKKELILSKDLAKSRLQAALGYDRVHGSPQVLAEIKQELLKALAPYFPVDVDKVDVHFIYDPEGVTLMASMPVKQRPKATLHPAETDVQL